jgi:predicted transposase YbfD/YdcC
MAANLTDARRRGIREQKARCERRQGIEKRAIRYYISSLRCNGQQFAQAVRNHWGIENSLHWSLDMTYREDESRVRNRTFADNLSWLRRLTLSLIKQHPGKQSNIMKRRMAGWSVDFLMQSSPFTTLSVP